MGLEQREEAAKKIVTVVLIAIKVFIIIFSFILVFTQTLNVLIVLRSRTDFFWYSY